MRLPEPPYRVLMFAPGFAPYAFSENLVNAKLALAALRRGWDVQVISAKDEGPLYCDEWCEPWLPLRDRTLEIRYDHGPPVLRYLQRVGDSLLMGYPVAGVRWARRAFSAAMRLHEQRPFDVVLSRSVSCIAHLPAMTFARRTSVPWIANWNDPPGFLFPPPYRIATRPLSRRIWKRYLAAALKSATMNTFPCARLARHICNGLGPGVHVRTDVVPHPALRFDFQKARETVQNGRRAFRLCHAGNLSPERDVHTFMQALARLVKESSDGAAIEFRLVGVDSPSVQEAARQFHLQSVVTRVGQLGYRETLDELSKCDVLVLIEAPCPEGIFLPSKVADYVQVRKPILAVSPRIGTMHDLLMTNDGGIAADCTSAEDIYHGLRRLYDAWRSSTLDRFQPVALAGYFDAERVLDRLEALLEKACRTPASAAVGACAEV